MLSESQLHWRCRRGVRELDVLFTRFVTEHHSQLSDAQKKTFEEMLEVQDPIIMDWLFGKAEPDTANMKELVAVLKEISGL